METDFVGDASGHVPDLVRHQEKCNTEFIEISLKLPQIRLQPLGQYKMHCVFSYNSYLHLQEQRKSRTYFVNACRTKGVD